MLLTLQPATPAVGKDPALAVWHHAFTFDGATYLEGVARIAATAPDHVDRALAREARRVVEQASPQTERVLEILRFEPDWLVDGPDRWAGRLLVVMLAEQLTPIPSLGGGDVHSWLVLDRLAKLSTAAASTLRRLVHGDPLDAWATALRRPDLAPLFSGTRDLGGVLSAPETALLALSLNRMEDLFRGSTAAEAAAFADWVYTRTPQLLARAKARAFTDARQMLAAAGGRSIFMLFEQ